PPTYRPQYQELNGNQKAVVREGRNPALQLLRNERPVGLRDWAHEILAEVGQVATLLDGVHGNTEHSLAVAAEGRKIDDPELTPSARVLQRMREVKTGYFG